MKLSIGFRRSKRYRFQRLFRLNKSFSVVAPVTERTVEVAKAFGLGIDEEKVFTVFEDFEVDIKPGDIVYVTGESGGGKTTLLCMLVEEMMKHREFTPVVSDQALRVRQDELIVHGVGRDIREALELLNYVGLNDAFIFLRRYGELSDGQKYRYRLAKAIDAGARTIVFDEFCATLDRETAKIVAYLIQKIIRRKGLTLVAATTHEDLVRDLNPNVLIWKGVGKEVRVEYFKPEPRPCSVTEGMVIEEGEFRDLREMEFWHYKGTFRGWASKVYRAKIGRRMAGVILYSLPMYALRARFIALPHLKEMYRRSKKEYLEYINRNVRRLARIIVHPKYRGIGVAVRLVKETMPLLGVPYVECLAVMPRYNPFLKHAGMVEVEGGISKPLTKIYEELEKAGFNLDLIQSKRYNLKVLRSMSRKTRARLRKLLISMYSSKFRSDSRLVARVTEGDLEAMAEALKRVPVPTSYFIWKNPEFEDYPNPSCMPTPG